MFESRYGGKEANPLQRGLWTHSKNAASYFNSVTGGWISYSHNPILIELFSFGLISTPKGHSAALNVLQADVMAQKEAMSSPGGFGRFSGSGDK